MESVHATRGAAMSVDAGRENSGKRKKNKAGALTLGARLRAGIGEVGAKGTVSSGLMARLRQTSVHYVRCVKPNDSMAAFGFEQRRVLQQLQCAIRPPRPVQLFPQLCRGWLRVPSATLAPQPPPWPPPNPAPLLCMPPPSLTADARAACPRLSRYSGILEMVRIRRQGFPSRMSYRDFEQKFAPLLVDFAKGVASAASGGVIGKLAGLVTKKADLDEKSQVSCRRAGGAISRHPLISTAALSAPPRPPLHSSPLLCSHPPLLRSQPLSSFPTPLAQVSAEHEVAAKAGRGGTLAILQFANLFEHRHYVFGKSLVFLRNGVEAVLAAAVQKQMLAITWFQKTARMRVAMSWYANAKVSAVRIQARARQRGAGNAVKRILRHKRRRLAAIRTLLAGQKIALTIGVRAPAWIEYRRRHAIQCQRLGRGFLGRKKAAWQKILNARAKPLIKMRWAFHTHIVAFRWAHALQVSASPWPLAHPFSEAFQKRALTPHAEPSPPRSCMQAAPSSPTGRKASATRLQARLRTLKPRRELQRYRHSALKLQRRYQRTAGKAAQERAFTQKVNAAFRAVFADDADALDTALQSLPGLALVRQNRQGQRAGLAHAAAAGGSVRLAPKLFTTMYKVAVAAGRAKPPALPEDASLVEKSEIELALAVEFCCTTLRDAIGRTPLHYAARWGQLAFVRWAMRLLTQTSINGQSAAEFFQLSKKASTDGVAAGGAAPGAKDEAEGDEEARRAVMPVVMPGKSSRERCLVVLGEQTLRLYSLPPNKGASPEALDVKSLGKPLLSLAIEKLLYRKSEDRTKRDCLEVVIMKVRKGKLAQAALFESSASEDVLELFTGSPVEARHWMAALRSPKYLLARGLQLTSAIGGAQATPPQTDLWRKWALLNTPDARGEGVLAGALRGVVAGEETERTRLVAWLVDAGAECLPLDAGSPSQAALNLKRASSAVKPGSFLGLGGDLGGDHGKRGGSAAAAATAAASAAKAGGPLALLLHLCSDGTSGADAAWAGMLQLIAAKATARHGPTALHPLLLAMRDAYKPSVQAAAPLTFAALEGAVASAAAPKVAANVAAAAGAGATAAPLQPLPAPAANAQNRQLVLLEMSRVDVSSTELGDVSEATCSISMVHEPQGPGGGGGGGGARLQMQNRLSQNAAGGGGGGGGAAAAARARFQQAEAASASTPAPINVGAKREGSVTKPDGGPVAAAAGIKRSRLVPLVGEQSTAPPLAGSSTSLWFVSTWSAMCAVHGCLPQLPTIAAFHSYSCLPQLPFHAGSPCRRRSPRLPADMLTSRLPARPTGTSKARRAPSSSSSCSPPSPRPPSASAGSPSPPRASASSTCSCTPCRCRCPPPRHVRRAPSRSALGSTASCPSVCIRPPLPMASPPPLHRLSAASPPPLHAPRYVPIRHDATEPRSSPARPRCHRQLQGLPAAPPAALLQADGCPLNGLANHVARAGEHPPPTCSERLSLSPRLHTAPHPTPSRRLWPPLTTSVDAHTPPFAGRRRHEALAVHPLPAVVREGGWRAQIHRGGGRLARLPRDARGLARRPGRARAGAIDARGAGCAPRLPRRAAQGGGRGGESRRGRDGASRLRGSLRHIALLAAAATRCQYVPQARERGKPRGGRADVRGTHGRLGALGRPEGGPSAQAGGSAHRARAAGGGRGP